MESFEPLVPADGCLVVIDSLNRVRNSGWVLVVWVFLVEPGGDAVD